LIVAYTAHRRGVVLTRYVWRGRQRQPDYAPVVAD